LSATLVLAWSRSFSLTAIGLHTPQGCGKKVKT
jgi:hypothetical protein